MNRKILSRLRRSICHGYTFIELILYVSIVIIIMSALIPFALTVIGSGAKSRIEQEVFSQARYVSERIKYEIRNANSINSLTATSLDLNTAVNPVTVLDSLNGKIRIRYGSSGTPVNLNANNTAVSGLTFTNHTSADNKTRNIQFNFTIDDSGGSIRQDYSVPAVTIEGAAELRSPFIAAASPTIPSSPIPGWSFRKRITILETEIPGTTNFTNFTVLISITDTDLAADALNSGNDILFTAADGITKLDHEIEKFNGTTGNLVAWVKIPTLTYLTDTIIYMYYGNPTAVNQQNVTDTWDSNYKLVQHLKETSGTHYDSTATNSDSTSINVAVQGSATGKINGADSFNANPQRIDIPDSVNLEPASSNFTVEAWVRFNSLSTAVGRHQKVVYKDHSVSPWVGYELHMRNEAGNPLCFGWHNGTAYFNSDYTGTVTTGVWYHLVGVKSGTTSRLYVNGSTANTTPITTTGSVYNTDLYLSIGGEGTNGSINGIVDEVRYSNVARSANWITAEYNNQNSPSTFYSIGAEEVF